MKTLRFYLLATILLCVSFLEAQNNVFSTLDTSAEARAARDSRLEEGAKKLTTFLDEFTDIELFEKSLETKRVGKNSTLVDSLGSYYENLGIDFTTFASLNIDEFWANCFSSKRAYSVNGRYDTLNSLGKKILMNLQIDSVTNRQEFKLTLTLTPNEHLTTYLSNKNKQALLAKIQTYVRDEVPTKGKIEKTPEAFKEPVSKIMYQVYLMLKEGLSDEEIAELIKEKDLIDATKEDFSKATENFQVTYFPSANQKYGFDAYSPLKAQWREDYPYIKLDDGTVYDIPYKSILKGDEDLVEAVFYNDKPATYLRNLVFKDRQDRIIPYDSINTDPQGNIHLSLKLSDFINREAVYAYWVREEDATLAYSKIGKLTIEPLDQKLENVLIVPVGKGKNLASKEQIEQELQAIYRSAGIAFTLTLAEPFETLEAYNIIDAPKDEDRVNYTQEMSDFADAYRQASKLKKDKRTSVIFVVEGFSESDMQGYMRRGKSYGFVSYESLGDGKTLAHELGHGAFGLHHTWEDGAAKDQTTPNLMSYHPTSTALTHTQWKDIQDNKLVISFWDDGEDGASLNDLAQARNCIDPSGRLFTLKTHENYILSALESGEVLVFTDGLNGIYKAEFNDKKEFIGYYFSGDKYPQTFVNNTVYTSLTGEFKVVVYSFSLNPSTNQIQTYSTELDLKKSEFGDYVVCRSSEGNIVGIIPKCDLTEGGISLSVNSTYDNCFLTKTADLSSQQFESQKVLYKSPYFTFGSDPKPLAQNGLIGFVSSYKDWIADLSNLPSSKWPNYILSGSLSETENKVNESYKNKKVYSTGLEIKLTFKEMNVTMTDGNCEITENEPNIRGQFSSGVKENEVFLSFKYLGKSFREELNKVTEAGLKEFIHTIAKSNGTQVQNESFDLSIDIFSKTVKEISNDFKDFNAVEFLTSFEKLGNVYADGIEEIGEGLNLYIADEFGFTENITNTCEYYNEIVKKKTKSASSVAFTEFLDLNVTQNDEITIRNNYIRFVGLYNGVLTTPGNLFQGAFSFSKFLSSNKIVEVLDTKDEVVRLGVSGIYDEVRKKLQDLNGLDECQQRYLAWEITGSAVGIIKVLSKSSALNALDDIIFTAIMKPFKMMAKGALSLAITIRNKSVKISKKGSDVYLQIDNQAEFKPLFDDLDLEVFLSNYAVLRNNLSLKKVQDVFGTDADAFSRFTSAIKKVDNNVADYLNKQTLDELTATANKFKEDPAAFRKAGENLDDFKKFVNGVGNTAEALKARELLSKLKLIEPQVTDDLVGLANKNGGKMEGLDFRLKSEESLTRKLQSEGINAPMNDVLRYTTTFEDATFVKGIENTLNDLKNKGYEVVKLKNTFADGSMYKGININMKTPSGEIFELQFHTPNSFNMKQNINHTLYEEYRLLNENSARAKELERIMTSNSNSVVNPPNVQSIK